MDGYLRREKTTQPGLVDAVVHLHVFAGVEPVVERAELLEDRSAVGHGHAIGRHETFRRRVDIRIGMMAQPGGAGRGDRLLKRAGAGNVLRLRPADAVGPAAVEGRGQPGQIAVVLQFAVAVDDHHHVAPGMFEGDVPGGTAQSSRILVEMHIWVLLDELADQFRRAVGRLPVDNDDLKPLGIVVLRDQLCQCPLDVLLLVPNRHDDRDEEQGQRGMLSVSRDSERRVRDSTGVIRQYPARRRAAFRP